MQKKKKLLPSAGALLAGALNGLLGSGGGMLLVPSLEGRGIATEKAHACSVAVMLPLSALSAAVYLLRGTIEISQALPFIPGGIIGALLGAALLKKISPKLLKKIFGALALYAGIRLVLR